MEAPTGINRKSHGYPLEPMGNPLEPQRSSIVNHYEFQIESQGKSNRTLFGSIGVLRKVPVPVPSALRGGRVSSPSPLRWCRQHSQIPKRVNVAYPSPYGTGGGMSLQESRGGIPIFFMKVEVQPPSSLTPFLKKVDVPSPLSFREAMGAISIFLKRVEVAFP